ncbi:MAG: hypothetical protein Greene041619_753 [Candidatus Peregrinibacteria bacterium Greene0416_19]|nr:MAG: hypothetical protein Greene041619_753 [Candidatus Peregrinibacteria bacterium Greene0416_19]
MFQRHPVQNNAMMFITTNTRDRVPVFQDAANAREAVDSLYRVQELHPFFLYSFVIMPDHCHFLLNVPSPESISRIMRVYKYGVCFNLGMSKLWQSRFHVKIISKIGPVTRYIHLNPVKAGLVATPEEYPWSSASGRWDVKELEGW